MNLLCLWEMVAAGDLWKLKAALQILFSACWTCGLNEILLAHRWFNWLIVHSEGCNLRPIGVLCSERVHSELWQIHAVWTLHSMWGMIDHCSWPELIPEVCAHLFLNMTSIQLEIMYRKQWNKSAFTLHHNKIMIKILMSLFICV